jgi:hypothetical protein
MRRILLSCLFAGVVAAQSAAALPARAVSPPPPPDQITAVSVAASISPSPVEGTDGRVHLVYELLMVNFGADPATVASVEVLDAGDQSRVLDSLSGSDVATHFKIASIATPTAPAAVMGAGQEGIVWLDASVPDGTPVPRAVVHRVHITFPRSQGGGLIPADVTVTVAPTWVSGVPAPVIAPPLAGARWLDVNGCCSEVTSHRGAVNPLNGTTNFPERTAIDFIQLNDKDELYTGDPTKLSSYAYYGTPVTAVADGEVVAATDGLPDQVPTMEPALGELPLGDFGGNNVIEKFEYQGHTFYAFYAHMAPGSVTAHVRVGDHIHTGQVVGQLGNSGNSSAPHLHFQVMDTPSALSGQGLPYEFDEFLLRGRLAGDAALGDLFEGKPATYVPGITPTWECDRLPLNLDVVDFPERTRP